MSSVSRFGIHGNEEACPAMGHKEHMPIMNQTNMPLMNSLMKKGLMGGIGDRL